MLINPFTLFFSTATVLSSGQPAIIKALAWAAKVFLGPYGNLIQICDGTADDVEIQAAIAAATGNVLLSSGTFTITTNILPTTGTCLSGMGNSTIITPATGANCHVISIATTITDGTIRSMKIDGNKTGVTGVTGTTGIYALNVDRCKIRDVWITNTYSSNILLENTRGCIVSDCTLQDAAISGTSTGDGITIRNRTGYAVGYGNIVSSCAISNPVSNGINIYYFQTGTPERNAVFGNVIDLTDYGQAGIIIDSNSHYNTISSNTVLAGANTTNSCISVYSGSNYNIIIGNTIKGNGTTPGAASIFIHTANYNSIIGNKIYMGGAQGILVYLSKYCVVEGNAVYTTVSDGIKVTDDGVTLATYNIVNGNIVNGCAYGVRLTQGADYNLITNNNLSGNTIANLALVGNNNITKDNLGHIVPSEVRTASGSLTAGVANAIAFAWNNPELQNILIRKVVIEITTAGGTPASVLDVGIADDATGTNRGVEFFDDLNLNATAVRDSWVVGDGGTQTKWVLCLAQTSAVDDWIVGQILVANASNLVGKYYIEYAGR